MKMKKVIAVCLATCMTFGLMACGNSQETSTEVKVDAVEEATTETEKDAVEEAPITEVKLSGDLVIYCPHPLEFINPLVSEFESQTGVKVEVVAAGTGELLKRVESEVGNPLGDIFWGGSLSTMQPKMDLFESYHSINEDYVQIGRASCRERVCKYVLSMLVHAQT